jgi:hypothetical protein
VLVRPSFSISTFNLPGARRIRRERGGVRRGGERGLVRVTVRARDAIAELEVRDSGVGIQPAELPRDIGRGQTRERTAGI